MALAGAWVNGYDGAARPRRRALSPKPHQLQGPLQIGPLRVIPGPFFEDWNLYRACSILIEDGARAIIDPGSDEAALAEIARQGVAININTHHHGDHMLFNPLFHGVDLWLSAPEAETFGDLDRVALEYGCDADLLEVWKTRIDEAERRAFLLPVTRTVRDGERAHVGDTELVFHLLPGHARGMLGVEFPRQRLVYTADVDLTDFGPWYGQRSSSIEGFLAAGDKLVALDVDHYLTGHEEGLLTAEEFRARLPAYLGMIDRRDQLILDRLTEPRHLDDLVALGGLLYPRRGLGNPWARHWEEMHNRAHLARLAERGAVERLDGGRWRRTP